MLLGLSSILWTRLYTLNVQVEGLGLVGGSWVVISGGLEVGELYL